MNKLLVSCVALLTMVTFTKPAKAVPVSLTLTLVTDSSLDLTITLAGALTGSASFDLSGKIDISLDEEIEDIGGTNDTTSIAIDDAAINLSDESLSVPFILDFDFLNLAINSLSSNGSIPLTTTVGSNPFEYTFDPGGGSPTSIALDEGLLTFTGLTTGTLDFNTAPLATSLASVGQIASVTQDVTIMGPFPFVFVDVIVSIPISFSDTITTDGPPVDLDFSGVLVATGRYPIPEPSTSVLLGIAIVALIPLRRRLMSR